MKKINRSNHTIELSFLQDDPEFDLFSFDYDFYDDMLKGQFEAKFLDHYRYNEIGFEAIERFQRRLQSKLNMIMPYYRQLYITELKSQDIEFLLNKDLRETTERTLSSDSKTIMESIVNSAINSTNVSRETSDHKESILNNVNASIGDGKLTGVSEDTNNSSSEGNTNSNDNTNANTKNNSYVTEKNLLISRGNIGITSSAELLEKWREVLINIDELIINECWDLFSLL